MQTLAQLKAGKLAGTTTLKLAENLQHFPEEIFSLADTLEVLDLSGNQLSALPHNLSRLAKLRILFCSGNPFTELPAVLADCPSLDIVGFKACNIEHIPAESLNKNLRWLILTDNKIGHLPDTIGTCSRMQKLMLAGNQLTYLPDTLANCKRLELLRISSNRLAQFPHFLLAMPRLAWLAYSGNPFCKPPAPLLPTEIPWYSIQIGPKLGEGASGTIFQGQLMHEGKMTPAAVKLFKAHMTSDGNPDDEMYATIAAGNHKGLLQMMGSISNHPEGRKGLIMQLLDDQYKVLGLPPTFESCTRDVFRADHRISPNHAITIARTVASVCAHLHARGIMHGDLYAHNILLNGEGHTILSDFGAACMYNNADENMRFLEQIEVAAYGHLLEDLVAISGINNVLHPLIELCTQSIVSLRPTFHEITRLLQFES